jgi:hypothetical protein
VEELPKRNYLLLMLASNMDNITNYSPHSPVSIDTGLEWNIAMSVVYGFALLGVIAVFVVDAWQSENFSIGPWYLLIFCTTYLFAPY